MTFCDTGIIFWLQIWLRCQLSHHQTAGTNCDLMKSWLVARSQSIKASMELYPTSGILLNQRIDLQRGKEATDGRNALPGRNTEAWTLFWAWFVCAPSSAPYIVLHGGVTERRPSFPSPTHLLGLRSMTLKCNVQCVAFSRWKTSESSISSSSFAISKSLNPFEIY